MATLIKIDRNGSKHYEGMVVCDRCSGRGWYAVGVHNGELVPARPDHAVCYKCGGEGKVMGKWIERTPEYQAKLDAKREAKAEAERIAFEAERLKREAEAEAEAKAEAERIAAQKAISQYVGDIGAKIEVKGILVREASYESHIGWMTQWMTVYTFKDADGNSLVWHTSGNGISGIESGDQVIIKGTVKNHSVYKDEKQTVLTRCKVTKVQ